MSYKGLGQYDHEYVRCTCFWGVNPGKYITLLLNHLLGGHVLDLGAGEGKNAIYLAERGFEVTAVECSSYAISNFKRRLQDLSSTVVSRIEIVQTDVLNYAPSGRFEAVISYGLLHCLPSLDALHAVIHLMKSVTVYDGYNVVVTFTNALPVPDVQHYLEPTLIPEGYITTLYSDWETISCEDDIISEIHPTTNILHNHGICRLLARRRRSADKT